MFATDPHVAVARFTDFIAEGDPTEPLADTPTRRARAHRDRAICEMYETGKWSIERLSSRFGVSRKTILRALRPRHEGV
jgi:AraC-like DNA-binding protein